MTDNCSLIKYLTPNYFTDSDHPDIIAFTQKHINADDPDTEKVVKLYYAIRDGFMYNPNTINISREAFVASLFLKRNNGHCVDKANLLAACARAAGIPGRLGFANVSNHIGTSQLEKTLGSNVLVFHGFTELFLEGKWVKATPAFNKSLCEKLGVQPLEFDGTEDSIFQEYTEKGGRFMEYLHYYGSFAEFPYELMLSEWQRHYPHLFEKAVSGGKIVDIK